MSPAANAAPAVAPPAAQPAASRAVAGCSITAPEGGGSAEGLAAYDSEVVPVVERFMAAASSLGEDVAKPSNIVRDAFAGDWPCSGMLGHSRLLTALQQRHVHAVHTNSSVRQAHQRSLVMKTCVIA